MESSRHDLSNDVAERWSILTKLRKYGTTLVLVSHLKQAVEHSPERGFYLNVR